MIGHEREFSLRKVKERVDILLRASNTNCSPENLLLKHDNHLLWERRTGPTHVPANRRSLNGADPITARPGCLSSFRRVKHCES